MSAADLHSSITKQITPFLPNGFADYITHFIIKHTVHFTVTPKRKTKLGDYRSPIGGKPHRISVNGDLNPYAFLVTTLHEMAHLTTYEKYGHKVKPHGSEWKSEFKTIASPVMESGELPQDVFLALQHYLKNAKASSCTDDKLYRVLRRYNENSALTVEDLPIGSIFKLNNIIFKKGKRLRSRYECIAVKTQKKYRVFGLAEVELIQDQNHE